MYIVSRTTTVNQISVGLSCGGVFSYVSEESAEEAESGGYQLSKYSIPVLVEAWLCGFLVKSLRHDISQLQSKMYVFEKSKQ